MLKPVFFLNLYHQEKKIEYYRRTAVFSLDVDYSVKLFLQFTKGIFVLFCFVLRNILLIAFFSPSFPFEGTFGLEMVKVRKDLLPLVLHSY